MKKLHIFEDGTWAITDDTVSIVQDNNQPIKTVEATTENLEAHDIPVEHLSIPESPST